MINLINSFLIASLSVPQITTTNKLNYDLSNIIKELYSNSISDHSNILSYLEKNLDKNFFYPIEPANEFNFAKYLVVNPTSCTVVENYNSLVLDHEINTLIQSYVSTSPEDLFNYTQFPAFINDDGIEQTDSAEAVDDKEEVKNDPFTFANSHHDEIELMFQTLEEVGDWKIIGSGISKMAFRHRDLPDWIIKVPLGCPDDCDVKNQARHKKNLESVRAIANPYDLISLPQSYLYTTSQGDIIIEEMFNLERYNEELIDQKNAYLQFQDFKRVTSLCDLFPSFAHNAGIIAGSNPPRIGIIDFDCKAF